MKIISIFLALLLSITTTFSQTTQLSIDSKSFISDRLRIYEPNPIHKEMSKEVESLFQSALFEFPNCSLDTLLFTRLLLKNSISLYEDPADAYRYSSRRSLIFSLFAMNLEVDQVDLFFQLAEETLFIDDKIDPNLTDKYCAILILELLVKDNNESLNIYDFTQIEKKYKSIEKSVNITIYEKGFQLLNAYSLRIKD